MMIEYFNTVLTLIAMFASRWSVGIASFTELPIRVDIHGKRYIDH